jgi:hypothetical protein
MTEVGAEARALLTELAGFAGVGRNGGAMTSCSVPPHLARTPVWFPENVEPRRMWLPFQP